MIMDKTFWKQALCLLILAAYLIGTVNGIGYSIYIGEWVTAACVLVLAVMAFPTACYVWDTMRNLNEEG